MIFGSDNRQIIRESQTQAREYAVSVQIETHFADGSVSTGSGTIIGENDVLTAAHVVYDQALGFAEYVVVTPSRYEDVKPYGLAYGYEFFAPAAWQSAEEYAFDFAVVTMDRPIGRYTGWADFFEVSATQAQSYTGSVTAYGYPGDIADGEALVSSGGSGATIRDGVLHYENLDAKPGQSGSGVFLDNDYEKLMGLISYESYSPDYNGIVPMSSSNISMIESWASSNDDELPPLLNADSGLKSSVYEISLLYYAFLGREPDKEGLDYWVGQHIYGMNIKDISKSFFYSKEYQDGAAIAYSDEQFLDMLYQRTLERVADQEGKSYWLEDLKHSKREDVAFSFATSKEHQLSNALNLYQIWHRQYQDFTLEAHGGGESETLYASSGGDSMLYGAGGSDTLYGDAWDDYLWGGEGDDSLKGGAGRDFFAWQLGDGYDVCEDFSIYDDYLRLRDEFEWSWGVSSDGWLMLQASQGGGLVLEGVSLSQSELINVV